MHLSCLGEISTGSRAHPLYTPTKKYNSICVGSFRRAGQPFVKCGVVQRLILQRRCAESPSWQFCLQISEFPALWKVSRRKIALQCCGLEWCFWWPSLPSARLAKTQTEWSPRGFALGTWLMFSCEAHPEN